MSSAVSLSEYKVQCKNVFVSPNVVICGNSAVSAIAVRKTASICKNFLQADTVFMKNV